MKNMLDDFKKQLKAASGHSVDVGFIKGLCDSDVIAYAMWNNFGTRNIPRRPFYDNAMKKITAEYKKLNLLSSKDVKKVLSQFGAKAKQIIQQEILNGVYVPNAESTLKHKHGTKPLVDTGKMLKSVEYRVNG